MLIETDGAAGHARAADYDGEDAFARLTRHHGPDPLVLAQLGQSLDGRIATPTGASKYINGREALGHLHGLRARVDAVVVGVGTAIADDPRLTTRHCPGPCPARVVIDPQGRLPSGLAMLADGNGPVTVITRPDRKVPAGCRQITLEAGEGGGIAPARIVAALVARGMRRILVEGGAETLSRFLDAGAVHELHLMIAPIVIGSGKTGLNLAPIETLDQAMRPRMRSMRFADGDMLCLCALPVPAAR